MRLVIVLASIFATLGLGQAQRPAFEVASVKPAKVRGPIDESKSRFIAAGQPLKVLIAYAYRVRDYQIFDGPAWISSDLWEIQAKIPEDIVVARPSTMEELEKSLTAPNPIALMLQSLLEERFQLKIHPENRELPIYVLSVAGGGPKLILADDQTPIVFGPIPERLPNRPTEMRGSYSIRFGGDRRIMQSKAIPLWNLVNVLMSELGRPVVDKTNLQGLYDVRLEWAPDVLQASPENRSSAVPRLTTAVQEQLGLRLESTKGPVGVIVVDGVQKPSEN